MAFAYLIDAEIPKNTGALRPLKVIAKQGTIVWADPGRPVTLCTSHPSNEIVEAIVKALSASCPERAMAGWSRRFRIAIKGEDPRTGKNFIWHLFQARQRKLWKRHAPQPLRVMQRLKPFPLFNLLRHD